MNGNIVCRGNKLQIEVTVFWYAAPCSLVDTNRHFREASIVTMMMMEAMVEISSIFMLAAMRT
jgi:hypothetical protein